VRINSPGHETGGLAWRALFEERYSGQQEVSDWNPKRLKIKLPEGGTVEQAQWGLAFGQLSPGESNIGLEDFKIHAPKDAYVGIVMDYLLKSYTMEEQDGKTAPRYGEDVQHHVELVRSFSELGAQDESGTPIVTPQGTNAGGAPMPQAQSAPPHA
jgi:hypothetical protein